MLTTTFFPTATKFRTWLKKNHATANELWVGYYKLDSGKLSLTWPESVDEALCFGWIDGLRKRIDQESYKIRFTPRKIRSTWSVVNVARAEELIKTQRMQPAGLAAYMARLEKRSGVYSYEQAGAELEQVYLSQIRDNPAAWEYYQRASPSYRKAVNWWIVSAKREPTRLKRLQELIEDCASGRRIKSMRPNGK